MNKSEFWHLVESAREEAGEDSLLQVKVLRDRLLALSPSEIVRFDVILDSLLDNAYQRELWAAAYIINGGCSDDGFYYFRAWLISQGESIYKNALANPQTLADVIVTTEEAELEDMLYVAATAYEKKTGQPMPSRERVWPELAGREWSEEDVNDLYPVLTKKVDQLWESRPFNT